MSIRQNTEKLIHLVERSQFLEAIETFYAPGASMQENQQPPRVGLAALLENERQVLTRFETIVSKAVSCIVDGDRAAIHWIFDFTHSSGRRIHLDEIAYQEWSGGKIVTERFYYDPAQLR